MLKRVSHSGRIVTYQSPLLAQAHVPHAFSTRLGGISAKPFDTLNLAQSDAVEADEPADDPERIEHNYQRLLAAIGCDCHRRAWVRQVHGRAIVRVLAANVDAHPPADALVTADQGIAISVRTADCVPILVAARSGGLVAAVHAGWRGLVAGVIPAAVAAMVCDHGARPSDLVAAVGPCISADHFEVGPEVARAFDAAGLPATVGAGSAGRPHVDLAAAAAAQLGAVGLPPAAIDGSDCCTYRHAELFYSHRRDAGVTGRMAAVIAVRG